MQTDHAPSLVHRLRRCASLWADAHSAGLGRLGRAVVNDSAFFARLEDGARGPTTDTLEKFARFLIAPANWPAGAVPHEVVEYARCVGVGRHAAAVELGAAHPQITRAGEAGLPLHEDSHG